MRIALEPNPKYVLDGWHLLDFLDVRFFVSFIGGVRSGHTLVNQIINAHKDAIMSEELDLKYSLKYLSRDEFLSTVYSKTLHRKIGTNYKIYKDFYNIGHYQGKTTHPLIIGNKMGGIDTILFSDNTFLEEFKNYIGFPLKFIWVRRNPLDQVASKVEMNMTLNHKDNIQGNIDQLTHQLDLAKEISEKHDTLMISLDRLLNYKDEELYRLMNFLTLDIDTIHLDICKNFMQQLRRHDITLTEEQLKQLLPYIKDYEMLSNGRSGIYRV